MRKYVNGQYVDLTAEEATAAEAERARLEADAANRAPTPEERIAELERALEKLLTGAIE